jgi:hypothetical protein
MTYEEQFPALAADAAANPGQSSARLLLTLRAIDDALNHVEDHQSVLPNSLGTF